MSLLEKYILNIHLMSKESLNEITNLFVKKKYKAKEIICEIEKVPKKAFYLQKGIVKTYTFFTNGNEYIRRIYTKNIMFSSYTALIKNKKSIYNIECITDCTILEYDYAELIKLADKNIEVSIFLRKGLELLYMAYFNRNVEFLTKDATERYLNLLIQIPDIESYLNQKQIASHIAITNVQLSRLKKALKNKF